MTIWEVLLLFGKIDDLKTLQAPEPYNLFQR